MRNEKTMNRRTGFTLIEMMVAMALTLFIMVILAEAFVTGLEVFSQLKAIGEMEENLRTAVMNLRSDLQLEHFEGKRRLSDPTFGNPPIREGFFKIIQGSASTLEGTDADGLPSYQATTHVLNFSVKARGNRREDFFTSPVPNAFLGLTTNYFGQPTDSGFMDGSTFNSQWAEVAYFLGKAVDSQGNQKNANGTPLWTLYRCQFGAVANNTQVNGNIPFSAAYQYMACFNPGNGNLNFFSPNDLAAGNRTFMNPNAPAYASLGVAGQPFEAAPIVTNVVSFDVQVISPGAADFSDLPGPYPATYDTAVSPLPLLGLQISLRVWDLKTQQSRQITFIQDL